MIAQFVQEGRSIDYTPGSAVDAGDVVVVGGLIGIAKLDIAAAALGALAVEGVFDVVKEATTDTFSDGSTAYWDETNERATPVANGYPLGKVIGAAAATDTTVRVRLQQQGESTVRFIRQTVAFGDFTDGGSTAGTMNLTDKLPAGAIPLGVKAVVTAGFAGDTSAAMDIGTSSDPDAFGDNMDVLAAGTILGNPADDTRLLAETTVQLTVTGAADFGSISAGSAVVTVFYMLAA